MKNPIILALTLLASPAYAHLVDIDKTLLEVTDNDSDTAYKLGETCKKAGLAGQDCYDLAGLNDPDQAKAASKCSSQQYAPTYINKFKGANSDEPAGARGHEVGGMPHTGTLHSKEEGNHFYTVDPTVAKAARDSYEAKLITDAANKKRETNGTRSESKDVSKTAELGVNGGLSVEGNIGIAKGSLSSGTASAGSTGVTHGQEKTEPVLSKDELAAISKRADDALKDPRLGGYDYNLICSDLWEFCMGPSGSTIKSPLYKGKPSSNSSGSPVSPPSKESSGGKPSSDPKNPPKSEKDNRGADIGPIETHDAGMWAGGGEANSDGTMIARQTEGPDNALKAEFEDCIRREKQKIIYDRGSKTEDQEATTDEDRKHLAEENLKLGHCTESVLGREFCQDFKNKQNSTFAQNALIEKEEAKNQALENLKKHGWCDPGQLGSAFCKAEKDKILKNPIQDPLNEDQPNRLSRPIKINTGGGYIVAPKPPKATPKTIFDGK
ncbi:MAG: hypothetical protein EOP07_19690 [Proteobacteria bacterium]|nr:MAG: hypothetical protein EOP07_19690 [Pseudomonadota bacterium]